MITDSVFTRVVLAENLAARPQDNGVLSVFAALLTSISCFRLKAHAFCCRGNAILRLPRMSILRRLKRQKRNKATAGFLSEACEDFSWPHAHVHENLHRRDGCS